MSAAEPRPRQRSRWRTGAFLLGAVLWSLLVCYPNPLVLVRNFAHYRKLPIDPAIEKRMGWTVPHKPEWIEAFVDSLLVEAPDWQVYRVPWYVPTAAEAARSRHGDCEARAVLLASLLASRHIPFEVRASFSHIWVDYPGRRAQLGESEDLAYLQGKAGQLSLRWPSRVAWDEVYATERDYLWRAMPLARKLIWLLGLAWVGLGAMIMRTPQPEGALHSRWRVPGWHYLGRSAWLSLLVLALLITAPWHWRGPPARWTLADLWEAITLSAVMGAFAAWLSVVRSKRSATLSPDGRQIAVSAALGSRSWQRQVEVSEVAHLELDTSPGGLRPWAISAALRNGERLPLVRLGDALEARAMLRQLGLALNRPLVVRGEGAETRTIPEEIPRSLRERAARRPPAAPLPRPRGCDLQVEESPEQWVMRYPSAGRSWIALLILGLAPAALAGGFTYGLLDKPWIILFWAGWIVAMAFLGLTVYLATLLRGEITGRLAGARVEIGEGEFRFHTPERTVERIPLDRIESVELGRLGEAPTIAVVSPERVIHLRDLGAPEHRLWVRQQVEDAIARR